MVIVGVIFTAPFTTLTRRISDLFFVPRTIESPITIIAIDEKSISPGSSLGRFRDWPRTYYAQALREINTYNPAVIGIDLDFREQSRGISSQRINQILDLKKDNPRAQVDWDSIIPLFQEKETSENQLIVSHPDDRELQQALNETKRVVLTSPLVVSEEADDVDDTLPHVSGVMLPIFTGPNSITGFNNSFFDRDGVVRRTIHRLESYKSFPYVLAEQYAATKNLAVVPLFDTPGYKSIRYFGKPGETFNTLSFSDVIAGRIDAKLITDRIVIIGSTAGILHDNALTPTADDPMSGVEILATSTQQILTGNVLSEYGVIWKIISSIVIIISAFLSIILALRYFIWLTIFLTIGLPLGAFLLYQGGIIIDLLHSMIALIISLLVILWYRNQTELKAKKAIRNAFAHYVSPVVVQSLIKDPSQLSLGGKRQTITVLFSDIVGFTTLSEKLTPEDTVALLNDYLTAMTDVIFEFGGTLDKYQGDAIMALFGAPLEDKNHAVHAVHAALRMRQALTVLHDKWSAIANLPFKEELTQLDFRVGIATGAAVIGNVGSQKRFDYTAIGDIVNLGSRLEAINRKYGTRVIVNKSTFEAITENSSPFACRKLDVVRVKGKAIETEIFEIVGLTDTITPDIRAMLDDFENARVMYTERNFLGAKEAFRSILEDFLDDGPSIIYKNRCEYFLRKPPNIDWSPIVNLEEK